MDYEAAHTVLYKQKVNTAHRECTGRNGRHSISSFVSLYSSVFGSVQLLMNTAATHTEGGKDVAEERCTGGVCETTNSTIKPLQQRYACSTSQLMKAYVASCSQVVTDSVMYVYCVHICLSSWGLAIHQLSHLTATGLQLCFEIQL